MARNVRTITAVGTRGNVTGISVQDLDPQIKEGLNETLIHSGLNPID